MKTFNDLLKLKKLKVIKKNIEIKCLQKIVSNVKGAIQKIRSTFFAYFRPPAPYVTFDDIISAPIGAT